MRAALAAVVLVLAAPAVAAADPALQPITGSFDQPVHVNGPDGDAARVFVVEKTGRVQLVVEDLVSEVDSLRDAGATFRNDIVSGMGGSQVLLEDPSGNPVELFQPVSR